MIKFFRNEKGQGLVEYIIIVCLIATAAIFVTKKLGHNIQLKIANIANDVASEPTTAKGERVTAEEINEPTMENETHR